MSPTLPCTPVGLFLFLALVGLALASPLLPNPSASSASTSASSSAPALPISPNAPYPPQGDRPEWAYNNAQEWYQVDPTQQDHARFHAYLSMAAYGDFKSTCPQTFTQGFTVVSEFSMGYAAYVPEMMKVVLIFRGHENILQLDWTPTSISDIVSDCENCQVAKGIKDLYMAVRAETNRFAVARQWVQKTQMKFSVTGHGVGGSLAALAGLDLGATNDIHYAHNQGMPRSMNYAAVSRYDTLFQFLAGQSLVAGDDNIVHAIPAGPLYHVGQKAHLSGDRTQWWLNCFGNNENATCLGGGNNHSAHGYYFTPIGQCGSKDKGF